MAEAEESHLPRLVQVRSLAPGLAWAGLSKVYATC